MAHLSRPVLALLLSLMFHGLLLLVCVAGWRRYAIVPPPRSSEVISVFTVQQEDAGRQAAEGPTPRKTPAAVKVRETSSASKMRKTAVRARPQVQPHLADGSGRIRATRPGAALHPKAAAGGVAEIHAAIRAADARRNAPDPALPPVATKGSGNSVAGVLSGPLSVKATSEAMDKALAETSPTGTGGHQASQPHPAAVREEGAEDSAATKEVLARPLYQVNPPPPYPRSARRLGQEGQVLLAVLVSNSGLVSDLHLVTSSGHRILDAAASEAVRSWHFVAGTRKGHPVAMWVRVPVRFTLAEENEW